MAKTKNDAETTRRITAKPHLQRQAYSQHGRDPFMVGMVGMTNHQYALGSFVGGSSQVNRPFGVKECGACFFDEGATGIRELHDSALFPNKKEYLVLAFKLGDLFAQGWLGDAQDMSSA